MSEIKSPMSPGSMRTLAVYLLVVATLTLVGLCTLWSAEPPILGDPPRPNCPDAKFRLTNIHPSRVNVGVNAEVWLIGCGFTTSTEVKVNATNHPAGFVDSNRIRVAVTGADVANPGSAIVTLAQDNKEVGYGVLTVAPATLTWRLPGAGPWPIGQEAHLLLLVLLTGALASCVYALKSLADYRGDNKLCESWFTFYLIQPWEGAGAALLFYLLIRGGLMTGASSDLQAVNMFGLCAIAGLAGAFSDLAFIKLRELFQTLFRPNDQRGGKLGPEIITSSLPDGVVGVAYQLPLESRQGTPPLRWTIDPGLPAGLSLDPLTGVISGTPTAVSPKTNYTVAATDAGSPAGTVSKVLSLEIMASSAGPIITTSALPNGTSAQPYNQQLTATGGTAPLQWGVNPTLAGGLTLDPATGTISGTPAAPAAPATYQFTVTDSAAPPRSSSKPLTLEIV